MGSRIEVPFAEMKALGKALTDIQAMLKKQDENGRVINGLDTRHGEEHVKVAEKGFVEAWETSIGKLLEAIGGTGELATSIGENAEKIDTEVAAGARSAANRLSELNLHV